MGLLDFLSGGGNSGPAPDLYAGALLPEQMAAIRQRSLGGAMAGLLKSGALDYTVPFVSGKVPGGFAAGLAGAAAGAQDAQDQSANVGLKAQEFLLNKQMLKQKLGLLQQLMSASGGDDGMSAAFGASGGVTPPEAGGQGGAQTAGGSPSGAPDLAQPGQGDDPRGLVPYIRLTATKYGIDPDVATAVAGSEGLGTFLGDHGKSGGAFQLYTGGGLGNEFQKETGLNPLDPRNEHATIDFALRKAAEGGWGPWNGAKRLGITGFAGIGKFAPPQDQGSALAGGNSAPNFDTGPVDGLQAPQPPMRLAQNGPIPMLPPGAAPPPMPPGGPSPAAIGAGAVPPPQQPQGLLPQPGGSPQQSGPLPQPPPPPMPQGLIPGAGAAPPPSGIPPVTQPQPAAMQQGAAPAQMPAVPSAALTPAQLAYAQRQQNLSKAYALLGIKTPGFLDEAAGLPFVGPKAAATAGAQYPYEIGKIREKSAADIAQAGPIRAAQNDADFTGKPMTFRPGSGAGTAATGPVTAMPVLTEVQNKDGSFSKVPINPLSGQPYTAAASAGPPVNPQTAAGDATAGITTKLSPATEKGLEHVGADDAKLYNDYRATYLTNQSTEQDLQHAMDALQYVQSGAAAPITNELAKGLRALGVDPSSFMALPHPAQLEIVQKASGRLLAGAVKSVVGNNRPALGEFDYLKGTVVNETAEPEAQRAIAAALLSSMKWQDQLFGEMQQYRKTNHGSPVGFDVVDYGTRNPMPTLYNQALGSFPRLKGEQPLPQSPNVPGASAQTSPQPPAGAIKYLQMSPNTRDAFDAKYGPGAAAKVLGR